MTRTTVAPRESRTMYVLAGALLIAGPLAHYLLTNHYPILRPVPPALTLTAAALGGVAALVAHRFQGWFGTLVFGGLIFAFADLQFDLQDSVSMPILGLLAIGIAYLIRERRAIITCITLGAFYLAAVPRMLPVREAHAGEVASSNGPPLLLHVILDEQWGVGGLRAEGDSATANFLSEFYERNGFELYPAAYSRYSRTIESIPELLSLGAEPRLDAADSLRDASRSLVAIPYFEQLRKQGYAINVFQTSFLNYCVAPASPVASCRTQPGNSIANIGYLQGDWTVRSQLAARFWLNISSHLYRRIHPDPADWKRASAGGGLRTLALLRDAIASGPPNGVAYFVHVLLPHRPLETDANCGAIPDPGDRVGYDQPVNLSDSVWKKTLQREGDQIRCAHIALQRVIDAVNATAGRDRSIIVIHGDHGARVFQNRPTFVGVTPLDERQLNGRFSTLLAVRRPGSTARIEREPVPVQDFIARLALQGFRGPIDTVYRHFVVASQADTLTADSIRYLSRDRMPWWSGN